MPYRIRLPETYLLVHSANTHSGRWTAEVLRACHQVGIDLESIEIVDEEQATAAGDLASVVLKICDRVSPETGQRLRNEVQAGCPQGVSARLIRAVSPGDFSLEPGGISTAYFRREFAVNSCMIFHTTSCVRLTHRATGRSVCSTAHRSRALNSEEALFLLESLMRSGTEVA